MPVTPAPSTQEKIDVLTRTLALMGNEEPIRASKQMLVKEFQWHKKKLKDPRSTVKKIEAKQGCIDRETRRIDAEQLKRQEQWNSLKKRQDKLTEEVEEIKKLRVEFIKENESMDTNSKWTPQSLEEVRNLEARELNLRRAATKKMTASCVHTTPEQIKSWTKEADSLEKEIFCKKRRIQDAGRERRPKTKPM